MTKETKAQSRQQNTTLWVKLAVLLVIIICTAALLGTYVLISQLRETNQNLQQQAMELEEGNQDLEDYIDHKDTDEGVKDVAKNELGMVDPDSVIYDFD